jgi:hypothetical protein
MFKNIRFWALALLVFMLAAAWMIPGGGLRAALAANKDRKQAAALQFMLKDAEDGVTRAQGRQEQAQKRVPQVQAQLDNWQKAVLKTHKADAVRYKVDAQSGQIKTK